MKYGRSIISLLVNTDLQTYTDDTDSSRILVTADLYIVQDIKYPTAPEFCI